MLSFMSKFFLFLFLFLFKIVFVNAEIIKSISIVGNERISDETVIVFSNINIGDDLIIDDLNKIIVDLYNTDFFKNVSVKLKNNILNIEVNENDLVQSVEIIGVKNKKLKQSLLDLLKITDKKSYIEEKSVNDTLVVSNYLKQNGYYFSKVNLEVEQNDNNTVNLFYKITLGKKAVVKNINFSGNKIFKSRLLSNVIITEENKF